MDPYAHPTRQPSRPKNHALQCTTAGPNHAIPSHFLGVGSVCGLGPDLVGIHSISLAARYRVAACSTTLTQGLDKSKRSWTQLHSYFRSLSLHSGRKNFFFFPSMAYSTADAFDIIRRLDRYDTLDEAPQNQQQKVAIGLFLDKLHKQGFAGGCDFTISPWKD